MREFIDEDSSFAAFKQQRTVFGPASQSESVKSVSRITSNECLMRKKYRLRKMNDKFKDIFLN